MGWISLQQRASCSRLNCISETLETARRDGAERQALKSPGIYPSPAPLDTPANTHLRMEKKRPLKAGERLALVLPVRFRLALWGDFATSCIRRLGSNYPKPASFLFRVNVDDSGSFSGPERNTIMY